MSSHLCCCYYSGRFQSKKERTCLNMLLTTLNILIPPPPPHTHTHTHKHTHCTSFPPNNSPLLLCYKTPSSCPYDYWGFIDDLGVTYNGTGTFAGEKVNIWLDAVSTLLVLYVILCKLHGCPVESLMCGGLFKIY